MFEELKRLIKSCKEKDKASPDTEGAARMDIICVCNQKGGCAKTTTSINLAAALAKRGANVLLLDLDPQAHASLGMGVEVDNLRWTIYDVLIRNIGFEKIVLSTAVENFFIAPANHLLSGAQLELANLVARESILRINLNKFFINRHFDYCIIDTSPTLNLITLNALVAATSVLIPFQTHYYSLEGMKELFVTIEIVRDRLNSGLRILGILPTLFDARIKANKEMLDEIRGFFGQMMMRTVIHNNSKVIESARSRKPVIHYAPNSKGANDYLSLAEEVNFILRAPRRQAKIETV